MIPEHVHFIYGMTPDFDGKPFSLIHYVAARSAFEINADSKIHVWYDHEPDTEWWRRMAGFVSFHKVDAPKEIHGRPLIHPAHRADVLRLLLLQEYGGAYLDFDTVCVSPFDDLRKNSMVMGLQASRGLCNATMLARKGAPFVARWLREYKSFRSQGRDRHWDEHSVVLPAKLARRNSRLIKILPPTAFFYPLWDKMPEFVNGEDKNRSRDAYSVHLWEAICWPLYEKLTPAQLIDGESEYARLARAYVEEFADDQEAVKTDLRPDADAGQAANGAAVLRVD